MTEQPDDNFTCAAMIGAVDRLMAAGKLSSHGLPSDQSLGAAMTHLNAWAIPKGLKEADAFEAVKAERDRLLATLSPEEIASRAKRCIEISTSVR